MGAQDKTEQVLRDIHILFSRSEVYDAEQNRIIVDKKAALDLLNRLNLCIYEMMEEHEMTQRSRDAAEREWRRKSNGIVMEANRMAEDVYAGAVLYTDEALRRVQDIMQTATEAVKGICDKMNVELQKEKVVVRRDQMELKSHLEDLRDTNKYLKLIEARNQEIRREKQKEEKEKEPSAYAKVKPEIKINAEYFEKAGIPLEEKEEVPEEKAETLPPEIKVNLDAEYFKWKEDEKEPDPDEKKIGKHSLFGKIRKSDE